MSTQKIINSNGYNQGSAVVAVDMFGNYKVLSPDVSIPVDTDDAYALAEDNPKFAVITATSGAPTVVAAITGRKIRVLEYVFTSTTAQGVKWQSGSTDLSGNITIDANGGISAKNELGLVETAAGEALKLTPDGAGTINGHIVYVVR